MYIIAELGSNFKSDEDLVNAAAIAKKCGADAIKYQWFSHEDLYGFGETKRNTSLHALQAAAMAASVTGIDFMCTVFSPDAVHLIDPLVSFHKVASSELSHVQLLERIAKSDKPSILSTGAASLLEIEQAEKILKPQVIMYCVAEYPSRWHDIAQISAIAEKFPHTKLGYSDHTTDIACSSGVMADMGATYFEKHVNFFEYTNTPDAGHSLDIREFTAYCEYLRSPVAAAKKYGMKNGDHSMKLFHKRRLIALTDILPGEPLVVNRNFGVFRSKVADLRGSSGFCLDQANGKILKERVSRGTAIALSDLHDVMETTQS